MTISRDPPVRPQGDHHGRWHPSVIGEGVLVELPPTVSAIEADTLSADSPYREMLQLTFWRSTVRLQWIDEADEGRLKVGLLRPTRGDESFVERSQFAEARSRSDGLPYLLTAGHCLRTQQSNIWRTRVANGSSRLIGSRHRCQAGHGATNPCAQGDLDVGIIRVDNPSDWQWGRGFVFVRSSPANDGVGGSSRHPRYRILRVRTLGADWEGKRVCASGRSRTSCGRVTHINRQFTVGGYTYRQLARTTMCQQPGDSGAPVYAYGTAYGLVKGGTPPCDTFYQGAVGAQDAMNVNIVLD